MYLHISHTDIAGLGPADCLGSIALDLEETGSWVDYVLALREIADRLEDLGWWLRESLMSLPAWEA